MTYVAILVEGRIDQAVARRIVDEAGGQVSTTYGLRGAGYVQSKISAFNASSRGTPTLALLDFMDTAYNCPVTARDATLPHREPTMLLRLVVQEIESWILADRANVARFLSIPKTKIPRAPETLDDPKRTLINLARSSSRGNIREDLVPADPTANDEGPLYVSRVRSFVQNQWDVQQAADHCESLRQCLRAVRRLVDS